MYLRLVSAFVLCSLAASTALAQTVPTPESSMCRSLCERDKQQCRQGTNPVDAASTAAVVGLVGVMIGQPKAFEGTAALDSKRSRLDVMADRQRADVDSKSAAREWAERCNQTFMQCLGSCAPVPLPAPGASNPH